MNREFKHIHWTINGIPACKARETLDPRLGAHVSCGHVEHEHTIQKEIDRVKALYPEAVFRVVYQPCRGRA